MMQPDIISIDSEINKIDALTPFFDSPNYFHFTYNNQPKPTYN